MGTITSTRLSRTTDGRKKLVKVKFTPHVPDPANQHSVEVVFEVRTVEAAHLEAEPYAVVVLSSTRSDTREAYTLSEPQKDAAIEAALVAAAEDDGLAL